MKIKWLAALFVLLLLGCKEEFPLEFKTNEKILVVEGGITNKPGPYSVRLSTTLPINQPIRVPFEKCVVTISDNQGHSETLTETSPGVYMTSKNGIQGTIGFEYSLSVSAPDGKIYQTAFEEMKPVLEIDSVYAELTNHEDLDYPYGLPGYQFYVDSKPALDKETYVMWNLEETYKYEADYKLYALYYFGEYFYANRHMDTIAEITGLNYDTLFTCWKTDPVRNVFTGQIANLSELEIKHKPLHFVGTETKKLSIKYSLLVQQCSISKEAYIFWESIRDQISDESFLYTKQPYNISGNLVNIDDPQEMTFGYFTVASVTEKRIYYTRPNSAFYFEKGFAADPVDLHKKAQPVYLIFRDILGMAFVHKDCVDCRTEGGVIKKPDFWVD
ncbi:MAG TPA: DUF4249 domain-containing protein [Draconibacterium sp.]|nr:DUF4249 domain-containing protein [Draconibacterium sp.]HRX12993.1 DUF4249 domain-containing protein [Draconibacterium sp.]